MRWGVLGPLAVWTAEGEPVTVPEAKVRALLAALLVSPGRAVSVDRLVEALWGDGPAPARPANSLHALVSRLRRALAAAGGADVVVRRPPGYLLRAAPEAVDSGRFAALAERARASDELRARAALFAEALKLWRGPAFADFADEPFASAAVAHWEEQRLLVREEYAETRVRLGEYGEAAADLAAAALRHPLRERLRAAQMKALYGAGRIGEALEVYQDVRRRLDEELGVEPGPELVALQRELLLRHPADPPVVTAGGARPALPRRRTNLPAAPLTALVGRSHDVTEVGALLAAERLVTLTGSGGVGKTRLALEVTCGLLDSHPDGVWLVELGGQARAAEPEAPAAVDALAEVVAAALGVRDDARGSLGGRAADRLADALRERRLRWSSTTASTSSRPRPR